MSAAITTCAGALAGAVLSASIALAQQPRDLLPDGPMAPPRTATGACDAPGAPRDKAFATPRLKRLLARGVDVRIAAFGSSSTLGVGASSQAATYPLQLQEMLRRALKHARINVDNLGVGGEVAAETAVRILSELTTDPPGFILWQTGVNDGTNDIPLTRFESVLRSTIDVVRRSNVEMALVGQQYTARLASNPHYTAIGRGMERIAREKGIAYVDRFASMQAVVTARGKEDMLYSDNFHLNDLGYRCMAEQVSKTIVEGLRTGNM